MSMARVHASKASFAHLREPTWSTRVSAIHGPEHATSSAFSIHTYMIKTNLSTQVLLLSGVLSLCGCAVDAGDGEDVAEADVGAGDVASAGEVSAQTEQGDVSTLAATRYAISDGKCHTNAYLKDWALSYCRGISSWKWEAYDFNFTYSCTGWWGSGHKKLWFSCANLTPI
jgi:hypothetical protein